MANDWDYIVVGAGASGCVVAARLSEDPSVRVLLVEAGGSDADPFLRLPGLGFAAGTLARYNWNFVTEPIEALSDRRMTLLQGKVIGGSSSINGMIYTRGHSGEYDRWAEMGCTGWAFDDVKPHFLASEANERGAGPWHGGDGPLPLRRADPRLPICDAFLGAASEAGIPVVDDLNANHPEGLGWYDVNVRHGRRASTARAYLDRARKRPNLTVLTNTRVTRIRIEGGRATGVDAAKHGKPFTLHASREVIVCGGAIMSPALLMLSGIGPADDLHRHGIEVIVDSPNVGANFQNHPCYRPQYTCSAPITARKHLSFTGLVSSAASYAFRRAGPLAESFASVGGFFKSTPELETADMQVVLLSALPAGGAKSMWDLLPREHGFGMTVYQGTPYSRGSVALRSADAMASPVVHTNYFADPRDIEILARGLERLRDVMSRPAIARYISGEIAPGPSVKTRADLMDAIRRGAGTSYHQCGTCAIGPGPSSVLDLELKVRGVDCLRVADNSIIPVMPNAALHAPAIMIGERAAAFVTATR